MNLILISLALSVIINLGVFLYAYHHQTDHYTDLTYGMTFLLTTLGILIYQGDFPLEKVLLTLMITLWSVRLAHYLFKRIKTIKKDDRFDKMRKSFWSFGGFWALQAVSIWIILLPTIIILSKKNIQINWFMIIGIIIWLKGFVIEAIADNQKFNFKMNPKNKEKFIQSGIWHYSRHPNYWGEILCWVGIFIYALPYLQTWEWLSIISPLWIIILLTCISGIPLLEKSADKKYGNQATYQNYKNNTSILIPWSPKKQ